jgi:hypothetical protein
MLLSLRFRATPADVASAGTRSDGIAPVGESALTGVLAALAAKPGYLRGSVGRSPDAPEIWLLSVEFDSVGNGRRALGAADIRPILWPLMPAALDEFSTFEPLAVCAPNAAPVSLVSDLAADAGEFRLGTSSSGDGD